MTDFALAAGDGVLDLVFADGDLVVDESLVPAVLVSLLTDRRAEPSDLPPDGSADRRGWWADAYLEGGDRHGSRLWLLDRAKELTAEVARARRYAEEALAWLVEDGVALAVTVTPVVPARGVLQLKIAITRQDGTADEFTVQI